MFKLITKEEKGRRGDGMRKWERGGGVGAVEATDSVSHSFRCSALFRCHSQRKKKGEGEQRLEFDQ